MSEHSPLGPSSLARRIACPASYRMERDEPEGPSSPEAARGTMLHDLVASLVVRDARSEQIDLSAFDPEDRAQVEWCVEVAHEQRAGYDEYTTEVRLEATHIHPELWGTADFLAAAPLERVLVLDWKFGRGEVASADTNPQLAAYAVAAARMYGASTATVGVAQAPMQRLTMITFDASDIERIEERLRLAIDACLAPWARIHAGDHCRYCRALHRCEAVASAAASCGQVVPEEGYEIARALEAAEAMAALSGEIKRRANQRLATGGEVPGWERRPARGRRAWTRDMTVGELRAIAEALDKPADGIERVVREIASIAEVERAWGKSRAVRDALAPFVEVRPGALRLARVGVEAAEEE